MTAADAHVQVLLVKLPETTETLPGDPPGSW